MAGIYIHIPFCKQACHYCDFHFSTSLKNKDAFLNALSKEIELRKNYLSETVNSIYLGGGTPSLLNQEGINLIFSTLRKYHTIAENAEVTLEANPDDLSKEYLLELKDTPVNRLSVGVQSFSDKDLKYMNRVHDARTAIESVELAANAGFNNLTIDLIYGTPTMNTDQWEKNLKIAFTLPVKHLSCYSLTVEPKTALATMIKKGKTKPVDEQKSAEQFEMLMQLSIDAGFVQYEISNFCKGENYSVHNSSYWKGESYLGLGPSAHSYNGSSRQWNISNNSLYIKSIQNNEMNFKKEILSVKQKYNEYVMTSLRTMWGTSPKKIKTTFGDPFEKHFKKEANKFLNENLLIEKENIFYLSQKGKLFADRIASELFNT
ncbi:MAG: radical SAM family heme chaperone HemW [Bacteroidia bacterium]